jgi:ribose transport system substrate-binding protein
VKRRALALVLALAASSGCRRGEAQGPRALRIAVVPKGTTHAFWKSVEAGARSAAAARASAVATAGRRLELVWKGPLKEDDREQQVQVVEGFAAQGIDGLALAPLDAHALARPVEEAKRLGIPTVVIDSGLASRDPVSFVATDNRRGGAMAADRLSELVGPRGKVILLRYQQGSASTEAREEGFLAQMAAAHASVTLLSSDQHAGNSRDSAKRTMENLLNRFGDAIEGVFAPCEPVTIGALLALQDLGRAGKVKLVGFDATPALVAALRRRELHGLVVQDPFRIGSIGVDLLIGHLLGERVPARVDTDAVLVAPDDVDAPATVAALRRAGGLP